MAGIYIHVPVCTKRCLYCSFYTVGARIFDEDRFIEALGREYAVRRSEIDPAEVRTIYIGGGTPSLLSLDGFTRLASIREDFPNIEEFTIEVNPEDVTEEKALTWYESGVNRISMGVQSMDDRELTFIGRRHTAARVTEAMDILKGYFKNISLDLIYGLPLQNLDSLKRSIRRIIDLKPQHVSAYSLSYEERTAIYQLRKDNRLTPASEEEYEAMDKVVREMLAEGGYGQYEISNYAQPGYESKHNSSYWQGMPYLGLGPGTHSYDGMATRKWGITDLREYLKLTEAENVVAAVQDVLEIETLTSDEIHEEYLMTRLRTVAGIDLKDYASRFGHSKVDELLNKSSKFVENGKMIISDNHLRIPPAHFILSDNILVDLF